MRLERKYFLVIKEFVDDIAILEVKGFLGTFRVDCTAKLHSEQVRFVLRWPSKLLTPFDRSYRFRRLCCRLLAVNPVQVTQEAKLVPFDSEKNPRISQSPRKIPKKSQPWHGEPSRMFVFGVIEYNSSPLSSHSQVLFWLKCEENSSSTKQKMPQLGLDFSCDE